MKIVFVSEMRNFNTNASSTQIMTKNLLYGFRKIADHLIFVAIVEKMYDSKDIKDTLSGLYDEALFIKALTKPHGKPLTMLISTVAKIIYFSKRRIPKRLFDLEDYVIISHSPSIDSALISRKIFKKGNAKQYIQYWGDPYSLSLILPEQFYYKRIPDRCIEKIVHKYSERIVYGTKSLYDAQMELFPETSFKSHYVEVAYSPDSQNSVHLDPTIKVGYFGNYYSDIRDIFPFYEAAKELKEINFTICGASDIKLNKCDNVSIIPRMSLSSVVSLENEMDIIICVLNKKGFQIPGKVFYHTNTNKHILVILDGPRQKKIYDELNSSGRFFFCENNKESIIAALQRLACIGNLITYASDMYSPEAICKNILGI